MTQEEKELLLKDLCARQPYKVKISVDDDNLFIPTLKYIEGRLICHFYECAWTRYIDTIKPFLRKMSSMNENETNEYNEQIDKDTIQMGKVFEMPNACMVGLSALDWLNANYFDYRGLIEKGLALEAPNDMYVIKN